MPPRSVCLNVFTSSLGDQGAAVSHEGAINTTIPAQLQRRDSAVSDIPRRSSSSSVASTNPSATTSPFPLVDRASLFSNTLRPMASTESMNISLTSKPCATCSGFPARRRCSRCKSAYYCDRNCQKTAWKSHRNVCEPVASLAYSAPATPNFSNPASPTNES